LVSSELELLAAAALGSVLLEFAFAFAVAIDSAAADVALDSTELVASAEAAAALLPVI
jgi:hypothetical protein